MILIDGGYLTARSRFAFKDFVNSRGEPTGAQYGFLRTIQQIRKSYPRELIVICIDDFAQWRQNLLEQYKDDRESHQEGWFGSEKQIQHSIEKKDIMNIACNINGCIVVTANGAEADDLIAYYASENPGSTIFSSDKDMWQLRQYGSKITKKLNSGIFEPTPLPEEFIGIPIEHLAFYRSLMGDPGDRIPKIKRLKISDVKNLVQGCRSPEEFETLYKEGKLDRMSSTIQSIIENINQVKINYAICKLPSDKKFNIKYHECDKKVSIETLNRLQLKSLKNLISSID